MHEKIKPHDTLKKMDPKELDFPETKYVRDIESRVFQSIILQCLKKTKGICLIEGNLIDNLLSRDPTERVKGIYVEQDLKKHAVYIRVEVNIFYGVSIPQKADEIQTKLVSEISTLTGLHVSCIHVIFKNLVAEEEEQKHSVLDSFSVKRSEEEYSSRF